jgi:type VI protein secretion system component VasF
LKQFASPLKVLSIATTIADVQRMLEAKNAALSAATNLLLLLLRLHSQMSDAEFDKLKAAFSPIVAEFPEQVGCCSP